MKTFILIIGILLILSVIILHSYKVGELRAIKRTKALLESKRNCLKDQLSCSENSKKDEIVAKIEEISEEEIMLSSEENEISNKSII